MFARYPDILTIGQVAEALHIGKKAAYNLVRTHQLGAIRIGNTIRMPKKSLEEYVVASAQSNIML